MKNETPIQAETEIIARIDGTWYKVPTDDCITKDDSTTADHIQKTSLPYKLGGADDPHFQDHGMTEEQLEEQKQIDRLFSSLNHIGYSSVTGPIDKSCQCPACVDDTSRTEATCDWYDNLRDDGRSDGYGESYSERNT